MSCNSAPIQTMMLTCDSSVRGANVVAMTSQSGGNPTSECDNSGEHPIL